MVRRGAIVAAVLFVVSAAPVYAGSPHFVGDPVFITSGDTLTVSGKEAGLGNEDQVHIVVTATAECINNGGNHPRAVNKTDVTAAGDFPVQNGKATFALAVTADFQPDCAPPMSVRFSNVQVCDTTNSICAP
jgi:hypothetical protein